MQRDYEELPEGAVGNLRYSLAKLLARFSAGPSSVRVQLALALAALAVHAPATSWEGGGVISWFTERMRSQPGDVALTCMLELLIVLPQVLGGVASTGPCLGLDGFIHIAVPLYCSVSVSACIFDFCR